MLPVRSFIKVIDDVFVSVTREGNISLVVFEYGISLFITAIMLREKFLRYVRYIL